MVTILQAYMQVSDAEAVELSVVDRRWQMTLDCLGAEEPLFSQGALPKLRDTLISHDMDARLFERTLSARRGQVRSSRKPSLACESRWTTPLLKVRVASRTR
jgi:hypothetical protein